MKRALGLSTENIYFKVALLRKEKGAIVVEALQSFKEGEVDNSFIDKVMDLAYKDATSPKTDLSRKPSFWGHVKQLYMAYAPWVSQTPILATSLSPHETLFRTLALPMTQPRKALAALPFQLETLLPFPFEEALIAASMEKQPKGSPISISLFATKKETLTTHLEPYQSLSIDPDYVTTTQQALYRFARWLFPESKSLQILYIGESKSCFVATSENQITLTQSLSFGEGIQELERLLYYLKSKNIPLENASWILLGEHSSAPAYASWLKTQGISSLSLEHSSLSEESLRAYALPIGNALEALSGDAHAVQLRQGDRISKKFKEARKKQLHCFLACCGIATLLFGVFSQLLLHKKQHLLQAQLAEHLPALLQPASSSVEEIEDSLYRWEQSLGSKKLGFPFLPTTPLVSDLLAWLSTHPALVTAEGQKKEGIEIKNIRYQLYKYPKLGDATGTYAARVDLELTADTPRLAREFHDALLKGDLIVDEKKRN